MAMYLNDLARSPARWPASRRSRCRAGWPPTPACRSACRSWRRPSPTTASTGWRPRSRPTTRRAPAASVPDAAPELAVSPMTRCPPLVDYDTRVDRYDPVLGPRDPRRAVHRVEDVLRLPDDVRRRAEHADLPGLPGAARLAAGGQRGRDRVRHPDRPGAELRDRRVVPVRPEELLLPGHAEELPDLAVRRADRVRRLARRRGRRADDRPGRDRARPHGGGHRQVAARRRRHRPDPRRRPLAARLQPGRHPAGRDRHQADRRHRAQGTGGGPRLRGRAARAAAGARRLRRPDGAGLAALRRQPVADARRQPEFGTRTETKNVNSLRSVERAVRYEITRQAAVLDAGGQIMQETRHFHEDTGTTTSGRSKETAEDYRYFPEPDLVPMAPDREWVEQLRAALPELPRLRRAGCRPSGASPIWRCATWSTPARVELVAATVAAGASPAEARKWWLGELGPAGQRRRRRRWPTCRSRPARWPRCRRWSTPARSTTSWPGR